MTEGVQASYDREADVLYLSKGVPVPAFTDYSDGLLLRTAVDGDMPCGVTVARYRFGWSERRVQLAQRVAAFLKVSVGEVLPCLPMQATRFDPHRKPRPYVKECPRCGHMIRVTDAGMEVVRQGSRDCDEPLREPKT